MSRSLARTSAIILTICLLSGGLMSIGPKKAQASAYNKNQLCNDRAFVNVNTMDLNGIQRFLEQNGSYLRNYSVNGVSAARLIYNASRENGINPIVILSTLQKEEGLITGINAANPSQTRLNWAMGYGYTDSVILDQYSGFANQIEYGTWQLKRNYSYWASNGSVWNVGKSMTIDGTTVTFNNRCTSSLYRYTPHLHGNYNFWYYFNTWGGEGIYNASYVGNQYPKTGPGAYGVPTLPNQSFTAKVSYKNTGNTTWYRTGWNAVHLGTSSPQDRTSAFLGGRNIRGYLSQTSVAPGATGTFALKMTAPIALGTYVERFRPVAEGVGWMGEEAVWTVKVSTSEVINKFKAEVVSQGPKTGPGAVDTPLRHGQTATLWIKLRNTGTITWTQGGSNPVHLGTWVPQDRTSVFLKNQNIRVRLSETSVPPGSIGTFKFVITAPNQDASSVEHFRPVAEYITWFGPEPSWPLTVR